MKIECLAQNDDFKQNFLHDYDDIFLHDDDDSLHDVDDFLHNDADVFLHDDDDALQSGHEVLQGICSMHDSLVMRDNCIEHGKTKTKF